MPIELPELPYARDALAPHISEETIDFHYGKHHAGYVKKLNATIEGTDLANASLEEIIKLADSATFNNAAQIWNHTFYWNGLSPNGGDEPSGDLAAAIDKKFGSFAEFKSEFSASAGSNFGSGWTWLVKTADGSLSIVNTANAECVLTDSELEALLVVDVWEHAYYIDYRNARGDYLKNFWEIVNWSFVADNFSA